MERINFAASGGYYDVLTGGSGNDSLTASYVWSLIFGGDGNDTLSCNIGNHTLSGGAGNDSLSGGYGNDILSGGDGNDTLSGGAGNDTLSGNIGDDIYIVDSTTDTITENVGEGTDIIQSSVTLTLATNVENLTLTGTAAINGTGNAGNNVITGNIANNTLNGGAGNDTLDGGAGTDTLIGGLGDDIYIVDSTTDTITENANEGTDTIQSNVTLTLATNVENLTLTGTAVINGTGNELNNVITGNSANNTLNGGAGNDTLDGGPGNDTLIGGTGDDIYIVDSATDTITENVNEGTDTIQSSFTWTLALANVENLTLTGTAAINGTGNAGNNVITGNSANNTIFGGTGDDTLNGGAGNDTLNGEDGNDLLYGDVASYGASTLFNYNGNTYLLTTAGTWQQSQAQAQSLGGNLVTVNNQAEQDWLATTFGGSELLWIGFTDEVTEGQFRWVSGETSTYTNWHFGEPNNAHGGEDYAMMNWNWAGIWNDDSGTGSLRGIIEIVGANDILNGGAGNDTLNGGAGTDTLIGGLGNDIYIVDSTTDTIIENVGEGIDTIQSSVTYTIAAANVENLTLTGTAVINGTGNLGNNVITGNSANNTLNGGAGTDILIGGTGDDIYIVDSTTDTITENANEGTDTIQSNVTLTLATNVENLTLTGTAVINGIGNELNNVITGNSANNTLNGGAGNDTLDGGAGIDTLIGGTGDDIYIVDSATDTITENVNEGTDTIQSSFTWTLALANVENLTLTGTAAINGTGNAGNNVITGNSANNTIFGGTGDDTLNGGAGNDTLNGEDGNDLLYGDVASYGASTLFNYNGNTYLLSTAGTWQQSQAQAQSLGGNLVTVNNQAEQDWLVSTFGDSAGLWIGYTDEVTEGQFRWANGETSTYTNWASGQPDNFWNEDYVHIGSNGKWNDLPSTVSLQGIIEIVSANDILNGGDGNDTLNGGAGTDTLIGGLGDDIYIVDSTTEIITEDDIYIVDSTTEIITENANEGTDTIQSSVTLTLATNVENLTLTGTAAINGTGNELNNVITGNAGNNILDGGAGNDTLIGGLSDDIYIVDSTTEIITENANEGTDTIQSSVTLTLATNVENLTLTGTAVINGTGNELNNVITGNIANNTLNGGAGNDTLDGGAGTDTLIGGLGDDIYIVDSTTDTITENANEGTDTIQSSVTLTLATNVENLTLTGTAVINGTGNELNNVITGNSANNILNGGAGNDTLNGGAGNDTLNGEDGNDLLYGDVASYGASTLFNYNGNTYLLSTAGTWQQSQAQAQSLGGNLVTVNSQAEQDWLATTFGDSGLLWIGFTDEVTEGQFRWASGETSTYTNWSPGEPNDANGGEDYVGMNWGGAGKWNDFGTASFRSIIEIVSANDILNGGAGNDTLNGGAGTDTLIGGLGNDIYIVDSTTDTIIENVIEGIDTIQSSVTYTIAAANVENLTLTGTAVINGTGNELNNVITGNSANNTLNGGAGIDTLIGGTGDDIYIVDSTTDTITENVNEGIDTIQSSVTYAIAARTNIENLTLTGTAVINGTGNELNNVITGNSANNTLSGGAGNDTLDGGAGKDALIGGTGNDIYIVDSTTDTITELASGGTDTIQSSVTFSIVTRTNIENLTLTGAAVINGTGNAGNNVITGNSANNSLSGGAGNDTLDGGAGNDTLNGGAGNDLLYGDVASYGASTLFNYNGNTYLLTTAGTWQQAQAQAQSLGGNLVTVNNQAEQDWLVSTFGDSAGLWIGYTDEVTEGQFRWANGETSTYTNWAPGQPDNFWNEDYVHIGSNGKWNDLPSTVSLRGIIEIVSANDILNGGDGNDTLNGGAGTDTLIGGLGDDIYIVDSTTEIITENANEGTDTIQSSVTLTLATNVENLTLTGTAVINGTGNELNNVITGNSANNTLDGGAGNDTLMGGLGDDIYIVDSATDTITENANEGIDIIQSSVTLTLATNVENLTLTGTAAINGTGNELNNVITGNAGNNILDGGAGNDTLIGGLGDDIYIVDTTTDTITENANAGIDIIQSSATLTLATNVENLTLTGTAAINGTGNGDNNVITGNARNNTLDGGAGIDILIGGLGDDIYYVDDSNDTITEDVAAGIDIVYTIIDYALSGNIENLTLTGTVAIEAIGNELNNIITGNELSNVLDGSGGIDTLIGGLGDDNYVVDNTNDIITENANEGMDTVYISINYALSGNIENLTLIGTEAINGTGNASNNTITGNEFNNTLDGGAGLDTLIGGDGNDIYVVDSTIDTITENVGEGTDTIQSSVTLTLATNVENLTLTGTAAINGTGNELNNVITGNAGNNILDGGAGNDTLDGGSGNDALIGGLGNDIYVVDSTTDTITENASGGTDTIQSSVTYTIATLTNVENLTLTGAAANGTGNATNNVITGNTGNNTFDGGAGNDTLIGGTGDDIYIVDSTTDTITENANEGTDTIQSSVTYTIAALANVENLTLTGAAAINGIGNAGNNLITGNSANNSLDGGAGNDTLDGGVGTDILIGGLGNDIYVVDSATDTITELANAGTDTIQSSATLTLATNVENLTLTGTAAINGIGNELNNVITGNAGNNILDGGAGNDTLDGGAGTDILIGGLGNDIYIVDSTTDIITELANGGTDTIQSSVTYTIAAANVENLTLTGTAAINGIGNAANNVITGNAGNNILTGGLGKDTLTGGLGRDRFDYRTLTHSILSNFDVITDFNATTGNDLFLVTTARSGFNNVTTPVAALNTTGIAARLTTATFTANSAAQFTFGSRTFVAINDATAGFSATTDAIIEVTGLNGTLGISNFTTTLV
ncbi:hypothetical protein NIES80_05340 [Dolichospermum planctonicum]|uniref:C-type lectin domain-containing protein n=1 Tax=Dolichospermum planctonicum TaxID=136072 RepID=A0A480AFF2_9CYAN|nr:hypothetical protein NIES80_05340 [Dolichospermum planctonicum]